MMYEVKRGTMAPSMIVMARTGRPIFHGTHTQCTNIVNALTAIDAEEAGMQADAIERHSARKPRTAAKIAGGIFTLGAAFIWALATLEGRE